MASIAAPSITVTTDGPGTFIVVRGMLIRDHESPTMMSIVTDKFVTPQPTALTPTMGAVHSGNYRIIVHGYYNDSPTGYITAVSVDIQNNNQAFDVSAFSLTYEVQAGAATAHIIGTVKLTAGGTVLNVEDYVSLP